ncbi:MAG: glycosyltransferase family 4 protein [Planctomycetes bacterium]|nr:glycosyltransferase family 4 protein [Planctomycetota bacterium]
MKILITTPIFPPDLGGPAVYVPSIGRWLVERGHDVKVVAFCEDPNPTGYPFPVISIPRVSLPLRYLKSFFAIFRECKDRDLVYVQEHLALLAILAAKLRGKPAVVRVMVDGTWEIAHRFGWTGLNIVDFQTKGRGWKVKLSRFLQRRWWTWASRIIPVSDFLKGIILSHGTDPRKVVRIYNAYNGPKVIEVTKEQARERLGLPRDAKILLTICRLMIWKGVDGILRALAKLPENYVLVVCGDGEERENWGRLARELGVEARVQWAGNVPHAKVIEYIKSADVFILNSNYEGLSHTLLEVMYVGCPIVASNVCGNPELVADGVNGFTAGFNDVDAIVRAVREIASNPDLANAFSAKSRERMVEFDKEALFQRKLALFAEVVEESKSK